MPNWIDIAMSFKAKVLDQLLNCSFVEADLYGVRPDSLPFEPALIGGVIGPADVVILHANRLQLLEK